MRYLFSLFLALLLSNSAFAQLGDLVWEDNFSTGTLDLSNWNFETGTGVNGDWGTGQLDRARIENVTFQDSTDGCEDGCLVITTKKERYIDRDYTSGRIHTANKVAYGPGHRIAARVKPTGARYKGQGFAFWMMPNEIPEGWDYIMWPQGGEVDIMEYVGSIPYHNLGSVHYAWFWQNNQWTDWNHGHQGAYYSYETEQVPNPSEPGYGNYPAPDDAEFAGSNGFHIYGIDWYEDRMEFFVDSSVYHIHYFEDGGAYNVDGQDQGRIQTIDGRRVNVSEYSHHFPEWYPFEHEMYFILSAGVGGSDYTYGGPIVPEAEFPASVYVDWVRVHSLTPSTGVSEEYEEEPAPFHLAQNYPNPFNPSTTIDFSLPKAGHAKLTVVNSLGQVVKTLVNGTRTEGLHNVSFDASAFSSGIYFCRLEFDGNIQTNKMMLLK